MPGTDLLIAFLAASLLFAFMPGPALMYAAAQTIARGRRAGLMAALGLHIGGYVHVAAAAAGLSALFDAVPSLYIMVKGLGALYLVWLGFRMITSATKPEKSPQKTTPTVTRNAKRALYESITVEILNPKTALFFIAFLPQFVDPSAAFPLWLQFLVLGTVANLLLASADLLCVFFAGIVIDRLRQSNRMARWMEALGGCFLVALGARLALQNDH